MSLLICVSSAFFIAFLLFRNKKYTIPFDKIAICIIGLELIATCLTALMSLYLEVPLNFFLTPGTHSYVILENLITVAPIEEFAKFFVIYIATSSFTKLRRSSDLIPYFILSACTFAALENSLYMLVYNMDLTLAIMRCLISAPCHIIYSAIFGFFYTLYLEDYAAKKHLLVEGLFFSSLFHGFMNICLSYYDYKQSLLGLGIGILILIMYYILGFIILQRHFNKPYCLGCGNITGFNAHFCMYCGLAIENPSIRLYSHTSITNNSKLLIYMTSGFVGLFLLILIMF